MLALFSCKKDPYEIGIDILPPNDTLGVYQTDTITVFAYSVVQDSIRTDEYSYGLLGAVMDPVFGKTTASVYTQFSLSSEDADFGTNPVLDSLVLILYYEGYYGDTTTLQHLKIWELSQDLSADSSYYSNQSADTYDILLADAYYRPRPNDSVVVAGDTIAPHLRINLTAKTHYLGNKILSAPASILADNDEFIKFMKGLALQSCPVSEAGSLIKFATTDTYSRMALYYHNADEDSLRFDLLIDGTAARFNSFNHYGYADASPEFRQQVLNGDTTLGRDKLYTQPMGGTRIKLHMPYLRDLVKDHKIAIANAQLIFTNPDKDTNLALPDALSLYRLDTAGNIGVVTDYNEGTSFFGGSYDESTRTYAFRLTRYIQNILTGDTTDNENSYLYISAANPLKNILYYKGVTLNGTAPYDPSRQDGRVKLKILFTRLR